MNETVHASCVAIDGRAVLIEGKSGTGKSDLALRLIDRGAVLVSDDYTRLENMADVLIASAPEKIAGLIEVRGLGILPMPHVASAPVALIVSHEEVPERLPEPSSRVIAGVSVRRVGMRLGDPSAPNRIELALKHLLA